MKTSLSQASAVPVVKSLLYSRKVVCRPEALTKHSEQSFVFGTTQDSPPKIAYWRTGTPILSKQTRSVASGGAIHYAETLTSVRGSMSVVLFLFQYSMGLVTMQPFPLIGL